MPRRRGGLLFPGRVAADGPRPQDLVIRATRHEVPEWAAEVLSSHGYGAPRLTWRRRGTQADVFGLDAISSSTGEAARFALKQFRRDLPLNTAAAVLDEFEALRVFSEAIPAGCGVSCARPLAVSASGAAYITTYLPGEPLDDVIARRPQGLELLARRTIRGLAIYHRSLQAEYGDFHHDNILVDADDVVGFVDPTLPDPRIRGLTARLRFGKSSSDLGYWAFTVIAGHAKLRATNRRLTEQRLRFTSALVDVGARDLEPGAGFRDEIARVVGAHFGFLIEDAPLKGRILRLATRHLIARVLRARGCGRTP